MNINEIFNTDIDIKKLAKRLNNIREDEKARIARQIHDELGQILTTLKMDLSYLAEEIQFTHKEIFERLIRIIGLTDDAINSARQISSELRVPLLDHLGLIDAIDWQIKEFQKRNNITCNINISKNLNIDKEKSIAIFRIIQ
ncbi:MAG: histidine kinase, partial [Melioribacteraceae bacterium]|nr:histidine kinase [Melioribacteraceae bacterium]